MRPRWVRMRLAVVGLGLALAWGTVALRAEAAPAKLLYHKGRSFKIPFRVDPVDRPRLREVQLWVSEDSGASWKEKARATPDQPSFTFRAPRDGEFWFAVRTQDNQGRLFPRDDQSVEPNMKVVVDTVPPTLILEPGGRRGSQATVRWEVADKNLDLDSLVLEYQVDGAREWRQVPIRRRGLIGAAQWDAGSADMLKVRGSVADRARNLTQVDVSLPDGLADDPATAGAADQAEFPVPPPITPISRPDRANDPMPVVANESPAEPEPAPAQEQGSPGDLAPTTAGDGRTLLVGSPRFPLAYAIEDAGPSGPAVVELWVTRDGGRSWSLYGQDKDRVSPFPVDLGGEGTFGLRLVARAASGLGDPPPVPGDPPETVVEVDSTPPSVKLDPPEVGAGDQAGKIAITWHASDPHLGPRPVVISYREDRSGAIWLPITDRIDNSGHFTWTVPANVPPRFHLRVDVLDTLGNRGSDETAEPILIDRTRPRGRIIGLDPSAHAGADGRSRR